MKKIAVIGSGFSSLSVACYLANQGHNVHVYEKNGSLGGRARQLQKEGFTFDMGPSWYWMPDIFDKFFAHFNKKTSDYYVLDRLDPGYRIFFEDDTLTVGDSMEKICQEFERIESGSSAHLRQFINKARKNYDIAINDIVLRPGLSPLELVTKDTVVRVGQFFKTISQEVRKRFKNPKLVSTLEFPVLFLGAKPNNTPSFYSFMNYADFGLGTWHPKGGMYQIVRAMVALGKELGAHYHTNLPVEKINVEKGRIKSLKVNGKVMAFDLVVAGSDYHHTETLLEKKYRQYSEAYWNKKTYAPSSLLFYVGFNKKVGQIEHHNLFFDTDFKRHSEEIYDTPQWPSEPLFYANFPSKTDATMAPNGCEAGFFLIPIAPDLEDTPQLRQHYFDLILDRFELRTGQRIKNNIIFRESFCVNDFVSEYNSYKGNAYGMANTLAQTAFLRPNLVSKKVKGLYFTGQLTVPGPGVPPALISGKLVADLIAKKYSLS